MSQIRTEQETFWTGKFGDEYIKRNQGADLAASIFALFVKALQPTQAINSVLEFGANIGNNMRALHSLFPTAEPHPVEINANAWPELRTVPHVVGIATVFSNSIFPASLWIATSHCNFLIMVFYMNVIPSGPMVTLPGS